MLRLVKWEPGLWYEISRASQSRNEVSDWHRGNGTGSLGNGLGARLGPLGAPATRGRGKHGLGTAACIWAEGRVGEHTSGDTLRIGTAAGNVGGAIG